MTNAKHGGPVSAQRISDWKAGRNVPARFESLLPVLLVLIDRARRRSDAIRPELVNLRLWKTLWEHAQPVTIRKASTAGESPFRGVAHYTGADSEFFTGRDRAVRDVTALVDAAAKARGHRRLVALVGAAGTGKTSLLEAGVTPALMSSTTAPWEVLTTRLDDDAVAALEATLAGAQRLLGGRHLVIIDGFEMFASSCLDHETRVSIVRLLLSLTEVAVVLLSVRADGVAGCGRFPELADTLARRSYLLDAMDLDELRTVITEPPKRHGIKVEPGIEELLLTAIVGSITHPRRRNVEASTLSILSVTMHAIWQEREATRLSVAGYRRIGGVEGVLHDAAESVWKELAPSQRSHAKRLILGLVSVRRDTDETRRRVSHAELSCLVGNSPAPAAVLDRLVRARLISVADDHVCLSHDLLLTWPRLMEWLEAYRLAQAAG